MNRAYIAFSALILLEILILCIGCHGKSGNPAQPPIIPNSDGGSDQTVMPTSGDPIANTPSLWGLYGVIYDSSNRTIQTIPMRGPAFAWNVVTFLQPPQGSITNMVVSVLDDSEFQSNGRMDIRVILHHPFPGQPTYTGFDVCGIFQTEGALVNPGNSNVSYADPENDPSVLNPDGYTRWMNPTEFLTGNVFGFEPGYWGTSESSENSGFLAGATINPYKYYALGLSPGQSLHAWLSDADNLDNRGMFPPGSSCARDYELRFPKIGGKINFIFNYAVLANWAAPDIEPPSDPITEFPLDANARYPLHIFATDHSETYHTPDESGGTMSFDLEIFDWDAVLGGSSVPEQVDKITVWSDEQLIPGGSIDKMSDEVEWNSGFTAGVSVATVEIDNPEPAAAGDLDVWVAVVSSDPSSYDQGFDADVPDDPVASYMRFTVNVKTCPKAFLHDFDTQKAGTDSYLDDVVITGDGFTPGDQLGVYLDPLDSGDSASDPAKRITASDVKYIDSGTITADFDLTDAQMGEYGCGCMNGCGTETLPDENKFIGNVPSFKVVMPTPENLVISTGRTVATPSAVTTLSMNWSIVKDAESYKVYYERYDLDGNLTNAGLLAVITTQFYIADLSLVQMAKGGVLVVWVTAQATGGDFESLPSTRASLNYQNFEDSMGKWATVSEKPASFQLIRSNQSAAFDGSWGARLFGAIPYGNSLWTALVSPPITEEDGTSAVHIELLHRHKYIPFSNGYQIGWCDVVPENGMTTFPGYYPITEATYGWPYNDTVSTALQSEFGVTPSTDQNFQTDLTSWIGWNLSGFDASVIVGDGKPDYLVVGFAGDCYGYPEVTLDEVAILVY